MKDLFVRRVYSKAGINIVVELDFVKNTVSLVEKDGKPKKWIFAERTPEYMNGWKSILEAMKFAVTEAHKEMDLILEKDHEEFVQMYYQLDQALKGKKGE